MPMRPPIAFLTVLIALAAPAMAGEPPSSVAHKKAAPRRIAAEKPPDRLPVPDAKPLVSDADRGPLGQDKALHFGTVTVTPGGFLDVGTRGVTGR